MHRTAEWTAAWSCRSSKWAGGHVAASRRGQAHSASRRWRWRPVPPVKRFTEASDLAPVRWLIYPVGPIYQAPRLAWLVQQPLQLEGVAGAAAPSKGSPFSVPDMHR